MELDLHPQYICRMCDADFTVEGFNIDEDISFCPYCGSTIDPDLDDLEDFDDLDQSGVFDEDR